MSCRSAIHSEGLPRFRLDESRVLWSACHALGLSHCRNSSRHHSALPLTCIRWRIPGGFLSYEVVSPVRWWHHSDKACPDSRWHRPHRSQANPSTVHLIYWWCSRCGSTHGCSHCSATTSLHCRNWSHEWLECHNRRSGREVSIRATIVHRLCHVKVLYRSL